MAPTISTPLSVKKLSSVVPAEVTADEVKDHRLTNIDLALKLHYIRGIYVFSAEAIEGATIEDFKKPMFPLLHLFYTASGRIRRSETGRPFIKCNDSGVRIVEVFSEKSIEEWFDNRYFNHHDWSFLVHHQVLGPDLGFSPLVYMQFTFFKCGGLSVGVSWAHVLGDVFSALTFINMWSQILQGHVPLKSIHVLPNTDDDSDSTPGRRIPLSIKRVNPVQDCWLTSPNCKIENHSFHFTANQLENILSDTAAAGTQPVKLSHFEIISAMIWKSLCEIRGDSGPRMVTICTRISSKENQFPFPGNKMMSISTVEADFSAAKGGLDELAALIAEKKVTENKWIEENGDGLDYILYGANLTFVDVGDADIYGLKLKGNKPVFVNYSIHGVGDEGAVLVLPGPDNGSDRRGRGKTVTVMLPENQVAELKNMLKEEWNIA
ncbi:protein ECERIFERUM 2-like [Euphorbia lathyris]|uniref:protein ECERIFERUM 2-like n=1 Tax=Euphorbia lathyris TaxID=212925 RepID=UPI0033141646